MRAWTSTVSMGFRSPVRATPSSMVAGDTVATSLAARVMDAAGREAAADAAGLVSAFSPDAAFPHPIAARESSAASAVDAVGRGWERTFTRITEIRVSATAPAQRRSAAGGSAGRAYPPGPPKPRKDRTRLVPRYLRPYAAGARRQATRYHGL